MILNFILSASLFSVPMEPSVVEKNKNDFEIVFKAFGEYSVPRWPSSKDKSTLKSAKAQMDVCNKFVFTNETRENMLSLKMAEYLSWLSGDKSLSYNFLSGNTPKSYFSVSSLDAERYGSSDIKMFNTPSPTTKKVAKKLLHEQLESSDYKNAKQWLDMLYNTGIKYGRTDFINNFPPSQQYDFYSLCNDVDSLYGFYDKPSISGEALKIVMRSALHNTMSEYQKKYLN